MAYSKNYDELTITDNFMFCKVMSDKELCKDVIETLLSIKIENLEQVNSEHTLQIDPGAKSVRYDVYVKDKENIFDIELQMASKSNLPLRARYYQSIADVDTLEHGENYNNLKQTYIIFICPKDYFGYNLPVYTFENYAAENKDIKLNDKSVKIFYNFNEYKKINNSERQNLLEYFASGKRDGDLANRLHSAVSKARGNQVWRKEYMTFEMIVKEEKELSKEEGIAEGRVEGRAETEARLQPVIDNLKSENESLHNENSDLQSLNNLQQQQIEELKKQIELLQNK